MRSKKSIKRQLQRRRRIERDAIGNKDEHKAFVEKDNGNNLKGRVDTSSLGKQCTSDMVKSRSSSMHSVKDSVWSWASSTRVGKILVSSKLLSTNLSFQSTKPVAASKIPMVILVLLISLAVGNRDFLLQATGISLPSVKVSVGILYAALSVCLLLPFLLGWMIYNASRTNDSTTTTNIAEKDPARIDDKFEVIRPLGLKPPSVISFTNETTENGDEAPPTAQLASSEEIRTKLAEWLPFGLRYTSDLNLVFSTNVHGRSLQTLYHILETTSSTHTILLLEAFSSGTLQPKTIIGMYASQRWHSSPKLYGDGRCFLFRLEDRQSDIEAECWNWTPPTISTNHLSTSKTCRSSHNIDNDNALSLWETFQRSNQNFLGLGISASGVGAGLQLNHDMTVGESHRAVGFDNEPLCGSGVFEVGLVEVYQLVREIDGRPIQ